MEVTDIEMHKELTLVIPKIAYEAVCNIAKNVGMPHVVFARNLFLSALQGVIESLEASGDAQPPPAEPQGEIQ